MVLASGGTTLGSQENTEDDALAPALPTRRILYGLSLETARDEEYNVLHRFTYPRERDKFLLYIAQHQGEIRDIVSRHLGLTKTEGCRVSSTEHWIAGSFNLCVPVEIDNWRKRGGKRVMIRFPLPYKIGELNHAGNSDEKLRCEAAAYVWIQTNCPEVPTPRLWGFGFSNGQGFTALENSPIHTRVFEAIRRFSLSFFGYPVPCQYALHHQFHNLEYGYLLIEYIEEEHGMMLSKTWETFQHDRTRRTNLFQGLSRVLLSLGRVPLPKIGSFTIDDHGVVSLTNRPLTISVLELENEGVTPRMTRTTTYSTVESYLFDTQAYHDSRLFNQPNSVDDEPVLQLAKTAVGVYSGWKIEVSLSKSVVDFLLDVVDIPLQSAPSALP